MDAVVEQLGETKVTKTGKTYYQIEVTELTESGGYSRRLNVFQPFNVGDSISYERGNLPDWPHKVRLAHPAGRPTTSMPPTESIGKDRTTISGQFGRVEYTNLLKAVVAIAELAGLTDHQAIAALNNTLLISLQRQGVKIDISSFTGTPF